ncbi:NYN domain-containing protein [Patescibacteria group bacterium]|nr:NYN domain-containing protein [Patescibacteria group bacterium]
MKHQKRPVVYAFIDSQNLNLGTSKNLYKNKKLIYRGWKLDFKKFYLYLKNKFKINKAFLFIGYIKQNQKLYEFLRRCGYQLVFKPTVKDNQGKPKGNVDAELVLHCAAIEFTKYDKAIIVAGDGDYYCLLEYLEQKNKLKRLIIPNMKSESTLLKKFQSFKTYLIFEKDKLEFKPNKSGRRRS